MIWTFERGDEILRLETRLDTATGQYLLVSIWAETPPQIERFSDQAKFEVRIRALEAQLAADSWSQLGTPHILSDGWRGAISH